MCQVAAHPWKINPAGRLAGEGGLGWRPLCEDRLTLPLTVGLTKQCAPFCNRLLDPVLPFLLRCPFSSNQVAEGVCGICVCLNTPHRLKTYLRENERGPDTDRKAEPGRRRNRVLRPRGARGKGSAVPAGFSRCGVGRGSGSRTPDSS